MYPGSEHFNTSLRWKFKDAQCTENGHTKNLEHNLDRIRSLSRERSFNIYGAKDNHNILQVEVNEIVEDDSDESKDYNNGTCHEVSDEKGEYNSVIKFSRHSSLSNRELDVIKESSRSSSDTEVTSTR